MPDDDPTVPPPAAFSNLAEPVPPAEQRQRTSRALAELDRLLSLPAGHPGVLRALGVDERTPVPADLASYFRRT